LTVKQCLFHGRGGLYPDSHDWTLDWYPPVWVLTHFGDASDNDTAIEFATVTIEADPEHPLLLRPGAQELELSNTVPLVSPWLRHTHH
jgi:hypothetical protein